MRKIDTMEIKNHSKYHILILMGAFILALAFRLIRLGNLPLSNLEAEYALQALAVARSSKTLFGPQMTYVGFTGIDFFIFTGGNFMARFWPGFIGAMIVFVPSLFRKWIGHWPASISSIIIAISPEMVGLSRVIGSPMMAFVFLLLAIGFLFHRRPILSGVTLALGLMSGTGFWIGILIIGLSLLIVNWFLEITEITHFLKTIEDKLFWAHVGGAFLATLIIVGTSFFMAPAGLTGIFSGLKSFVVGFGASYSRPYGLMLLILIAYTIPALVFGIWGGIRGIIVRNKLDLFLVVWFIFGLSFVLLYPGSRQPDFIWITFPLWILSARVIFFAWRLPKHSRIVMIITAVMVVVLSAFLLMSMRAIVNPTVQQSRQVELLIALTGGIVLLAAMVLLVGYGWSEDVAMSGLLIGLAAVILLGMVSVSVNSTGLAPERSKELWYPDEAQYSSEWLQVSLDRIIGWNASGGPPVEIAISDLDTPALRWILRDYAPVDFVPYLAPQTQPGILITDVREIPELTNTYRGQKLVLSRQVLWEEMSPFQYLTWIITRDAPESFNEIIFWVQTDLMADDQFSR